MGRVTPLHRPLPAPGLSGGPAAWTDLCSERLRSTAPSRPASSRASALTSGGIR
jgi:hypothetical protein